MKISCFCLCGTTETICKEVQAVDQLGVRAQLGEDRPVRVQKMDVAQRSSARLPCMNSTSIVSARCSTVASTLTSPKHEVLGWLQSSSALLSAFSFSLRSSVPAGGGKWGEQRARGLLQVLQLGNQVPALSGQVLIAPENVANERRFAPPVDLLLQGVVQLLQTADGVLQSVPRHR